MDSAANDQATTLLGQLAEQHGMMARSVTAQFTGGGEGYSVEVCPAGSNPHAFGGMDCVVTFYNDDKFGPRYIGRAGRSVPADKVAAYVAAVAAQPDIHPQDLHYKLFGG